MGEYGKKATEAGKIVYIREGAKEALKDQIENKNSDSAKKIKESLNNTEGEVLKDQNNQKKKAKDELLKPKDDILKPLTGEDASSTNSTTSSSNSTKVKEITIDSTNKTD
jgi:guanylate kinase